MLHKLVDDGSRLLEILVFMLEETIELSLARSQQADYDLAELARRSPVLMHRCMPCASASSLLLSLREVREGQGRGEIAAEHLRRAIVLGQVSDLRQLEAKAGGDLAQGEPSTLDVLQSHLPHRHGVGDCQVVSSYADPGDRGGRIDGRAGESQAASEEEEKRLTVYPARASSR